ncbi:ABC transporter ATP-binding protein [Dactylosporangium sp. NPDC051541]|uniref:ABC transporter ATP-binding protein n=1 Tax=Dactylosporangium sp. NPDC051541 TaxID=3363977 RepID=UPI00378A4A14
MPVVQLQELTRQYRNGVTALNNVSVAFEPATFTAIMGPSGSGKSTLLQCAAGLDRPTSGRVVLDGHDLTALNERRLAKLRRSRIGFVFQGFNLLPALTARQNVGLPLRLAGKRPDKATVERGLAAVGLADRGSHRPHELSGGQQQRVAIARALVTAPAVLFADEPTGALDSASGRDVLRLLRDLVDEHGQTIIMVTHDETAAKHADHVLHMADGRLA